MPPPKPLTTLGWLKYLEDAYFDYWEQMHLRFLHRCLSSDWRRLQGVVYKATLH